MRKLLFCLVLASVSGFAQTTGSHWKVLYVRDGDMMTLMKAKKSEVLISIPEHKFSGSIGCTAFNGNVEYIKGKGDHIKPVKLTVTKDKCPATPDRLEAKVTDVLKTADQLVIGADKAKFYKGKLLVLELYR